MILVQHNLFLAPLSGRVNSLADIDQLCSIRTLIGTLAQLMNLYVKTDPRLMGIEGMLWNYCRSAINCAPTFFDIEFPASLKLAGALF